MHFLGGLGQFFYILLIYALFGLKEIASHTSMQMVRSNEKNDIICSSSMSEQMRNVEPHARLSGNRPHSPRLCSDWLRIFGATDESTNSLKIYHAVTQALRCL